MSISKRTEIAWRIVGEFNTKDDAQMYCDSNNVSIRRSAENRQVFRCKPWKLYNCLYQISVKRCSQWFLVEEANWHTHDESHQRRGLAQPIKEVIDGVIEKFKHNHSLAFFLFAD